MSAIRRLNALQAILFAIVVLRPASRCYAQVTSALTGTVTDETGAAIAGATILVGQASTNAERQVHTNETGRYQIAALDVSSYRVVVRAAGFRTQVIENLALEVGRTAVQDFVLSIGSLTEQVNVTASTAITDRATFTAGYLVDRRAIDTTPLNGNHFVDLGLLAPGSVTPSQTGIQSRPTRGTGTFAINTAGNREDTVTFLVNGIVLNDQLNNYLIMQPTLGAIDEYRLDTSTPSAEFGRNSGAVANVVTRSGTNLVRGSAFELFRDDAFDARNYFAATSMNQPPFRRHQFGGDGGGPILQNKMFFFAAYEGVRQDEGLDTNSVVPSDSQRASVVDPTINRLMALLPRANVRDSTGTARFVGFAPASVVVNQTAVDVLYKLPADGRLHTYYAVQLDDATEPLQSGNTVPGFGQTRHFRRQLLTFGLAQPLGSYLVNEARVGISRLDVDANPTAALNPEAFGIATGIDRPIGIPQINVAGAFNFGGPATFPQGFRDANLAVADGLSVLRGRHALKFGGEFRRHYNNNFQLDPGTFNFPNVAAFLTGTATSFSIFSGDRSSHITQGALGLFAQDAYRWRSNLTIEGGLRYEWNMTPVERDNRFVVFDPSTTALLRVGIDTDAPVYRQNDLNFEPRVGFVWMTGGGRTVVRGGYAITVQEPPTNVVLNLTANPPFGVPLGVTGPVRLETAIQTARAAGLAPLTIQPDYRNGSVHSWNAALQRELVSHLAVTVSYVGSTGTDLPVVLNINQPVGGVRPFQSLSATSPILPATALGNIIGMASAGRSTYKALWTTVTRRLENGLVFEASYTLSSSKDTNSLSAPPTRVTVQNSFDPLESFGPSDFDARHRIVITFMYEFPWRHTPFADGWRVAAVYQGQSGNPLNVVTSNSTVNGTANTLRPDLTGPIRLLEQPDEWFDTSAFTAVDRFGNLSRNAIVGPRFDNLDVSIGKTMRIGPVTTELRADVFNVLNHTNFGQPGTVVGSPNFGRITNTRLPSGDVGSSRQIQLAVRVNLRQLS
jgi:hypothetical protein